MAEKVSHCSSLSTSQCRASEECVYMYEMYMNSEDVSVGGITKLPKL